MTIFIHKSRYCLKTISRSFNYLDSPLVQLSASVFQNKRILIYCEGQRNLCSTACSSRLVKMPTQSASGRNSRLITISVDGNISSGKSTLVSNLKEIFPKKFDFQVDLVPEPLEKWTNVRGHNLLGMFYEDITKNNFMFQHYVQLTRLMEEIKKPIQQSGQEEDGRNGTVRILERSLQNNRYCFTELARREGRLQPEEFAVLAEWHSWLEKQFDLSLDAIVYLRTDPQTVYNRMQKRGRSEESSVPMDYLKSLHETYENWLNREQIGYKKTTEAGASVGQENQVDITHSKCTKTRQKQRVIVIDGNQSIKDVAEECSWRLKELMKQLGHHDETIS